MSENNNIHQYYSPNELYNRIMAGLEEIGKEGSNLTLEDLHPVDEFHIRGTTATNELIDLCGFTSDMHILDVGCGVGGSTRRLSHYIGCHVTGVDLSDEYIDAARRLTEHLDMQDRVNFQTANALQLPFEDQFFDGIWSIQMGMNVEDKQAWMQELYRVIRPKGRTILYEVCASRNTPLYFPVPWAHDSSISFLETPDEFHKIITGAGFNIEVWDDKTELARKAFGHMREPRGNPELPELGLHLLVGDDILTKAWNLSRNLNEERVSLIEAVLVKPD